MFISDLQDELEYWKSRAARLTLLVEQINTMPCKMTLVVLRTAQCKLMKVSILENRNYSITPLYLFLSIGR